MTKKLQVTDAVEEAAERLRKIKDGELSPEGVDIKAQELEKKSRERANHFNEFVYEKNAYIFIPVEIQFYIIDVLKGMEQDAFGAQFTSNLIIEEGRKGEVGIPASYLKWLPQYLAFVSEEKKDVVYQINRKADFSGIEISEPITLYKEVGIQAFVSYNTLSEIHEANIKEGIAFPAEKEGEATGKVDVANKVVESE